MSPPNKSRPSHKKKLNHKKHGGALSDDLKTLAVPFAILLAKQGLEERKKNIPNKSSTKNPSSTKSPTSFRRKTTMTGGNCGPCNGAGLVANTQTGGKMKKLSKAIDNFLKKY